MYSRSPRLLIQTKGKYFCLKDWLLLCLILLLLGACSFSSVESKANSQRYDYALSIEIEAHDDRQAVAKLYGGEVLVWQPEAQLAVLGFYGSELSTLAKDAELNQDALQTPEYTGLGNAWANKYKAWAGGWTAWTSEGQNLTTLDENINKWEQIQLQEAQKLAKNLGEGVTVAVLDTGIDLDHPAFRDNLAPENEYFDFVDKDNWPQEELSSEQAASAYGHGTGVAGIVLQVAPQVTLLPLRVLKSDGSGDLTDIVAAIDWAIEHGADIINLSLGSSEDYKTLKDVLKYAKKEEIILVASAGNNGEKKLEFPARSSGETVSVGSVTDEDIKSEFSAYGKELEIMAPGEMIYTTAPDAGIVPWSGTSFAAPVVTGAIALALGERDEYPKLKVKDLEKKLKETARDISKEEENKPYKKDIGDGRLDIYAFLQKVFK